MERLCTQVTKSSFIAVQSWVIKNWKKNDKDQKFINISHQIYKIFTSKLQNSNFEVDSVSVLRNFTVFFWIRTKVFELLIHKLNLWVTYKVTFFDQTSEVSQIKCSSYKLNEKLSYTLYEISYYISNISNKLSPKILLSILFQTSPSKTTFGYIDNAQIIKKTSDLARSSNSLIVIYARRKPRHQLLGRKKIETGTFVRATRSSRCPR